MNIDISVISPIYNEKENIENLINSLVNALDMGFKNYEIILVNDGSNDGSKELLDKMKDKYSFIKIIHFLKNKGQTAALLAGLNSSVGKLILTIDADLQTDPKDLYLLLNHIDKYDFVNGKRTRREDGLIKKISSKVGNGVRNFITGDNIQDTGCPLKLFKREVIKSFYPFNGMHRFFPTLAKIYGFNVIEISVNHYKREFGVSKYGVLNRAFVGLCDAFVMRWIKSRFLNLEIEQAVSNNDKI